MSKELQEKFDSFLVDSYDKANYKCSSVICSFIERMGWEKGTRLEEMGIDRVPTVSFFKASISAWLFQAYPQFPELVLLMGKKGRPLSGIRLDLLRFTNPYNSINNNTAKGSTKHFHKRMAASALANAIYKDKAPSPSRVAGPRRKLAR